MMPDSIALKRRLPWLQTGQVSNQVMVHLWPCKLQFLAGEALQRELCRLHCPRGHFHAHATFQLCGADSLCSRNPKLGGVQRSAHMQM